MIPGLCISRRLGIISSSIKYPIKTVYTARAAAGQAVGTATAQEFEQELVQGFLFSLISSGIETISSTAKAKAEMNADVSELQRDVDDLLRQTDMQNPEDVERLAGDAYRRIAELEDRIGSTYYAGQQDAVDDALRGLDELGRMIEDAYPDVDLGDGMAANGGIAYTESPSITIPDTEIGRSVGAKSKNYDILDPESGEYYGFMEGTKLQDCEAFAGYRTHRQLDSNVADGLAEQIGGASEKWQHCKGYGHIDVNGEDVAAEVHWFQEESVGKHKFKIKRWLYNDR